MACDPLLSISEFLVTALPALSALVSLPKMDVLHLRLVTGGERKQTRCQSQGVFPLHQLSDVYGGLQLSGGLLGSHTAPINQEVLQQVSRSLPRHSGGSALLFLCYSKFSAFAWWYLSGKHLRRQAHEDQLLGGFCD